MSSPLVSIVMLAWNRKDDVFESLKNIEKITYKPIEMIVVDNGSTDGTQEMLEEHFPEVQLIRMYKNVGIEAYNIGFENAKGEYIVILDDDSFPAQDAIEKMVERFEADVELGVVAFDIRNFYSYDEIKNEQIETKSAIAKSNQYIQSFTGAGAGVRRELFKKIGYYPEEFFLYMNEMDCALRIWDEGCRIEFFADIVAYHKYSPMNRASWRAPFYYTRNSFWLVWKNYPTDLAIKETMKLVYNCFYYSLEQKTTIYVKALWAAVKDIHLLKGRRKVVRRDIAENLRVPLEVPFTMYR